MTATPSVNLLDFSKSQESFNLGGLITPEPHSHGAHQVLFQRANFAHATGRYHEALRLYTEILRDNEHYPAVWGCAGNTLQELGDLDNAAIMYRRALIYTPGNPEVNFTLSKAYRNVGKFAEAAEFAAFAADHLPNDKDATIGAAHSWLQLGEFEKGWGYYAKRRLSVGKTPRDYLPTWDGRPLAEDEYLLLWLEQGVGEEVMFSSIIPDVMARVPAEKITLACRDRMMPMFARAFPMLKLSLIDPVEMPVKGYQAALGDLGGIFRRSMAEFPAPAAYLSADPEKVTGFKAKYGRGFKVGLSWASPRSKFASEYKGFALGEMAPLMAADAKFISLQYDLDRAEAGRWPITVDETFDTRLDLDDYAAQIASMDLVITASNTCAHLAGAMGVEAWVVLPATRGLLWHWFLDREDSPWYPNVRLFRRGLKEKDWSGVMGRVVSALDDKIRRG